MCGCAPGQQSMRPARAGAGRGSARSSINEESANVSSDRSTITSRGARSATEIERAGGAALVARSSSPEHAGWSCSSKLTMAGTYCIPPVVHGSGRYLVAWSTMKRSNEALTNVIDPELGLDFVELGLDLRRRDRRRQGTRHVHADDARVPDRAPGLRADRRSSSASSRASTRSSSTWSSPRRGPRTRCPRTRSSRSATEPVACDEPPRDAGCSARRPPRRRDGTRSRQRSTHAERRRRLCASVLATDSTPDRALRAAHRDVAATVARSRARVRAARAPAVARSGGSAPAAAQGAPRALRRRRACRSDPPRCSCRRRPARAADRRAPTPRTPRRRHGPRQPIARPAAAGPVPRPGTVLLAARSRRRNVAHRARRVGRHRLAQADRAVRRQDLLLAATTYRQRRRDRLRELDHGRRARRRRRGRTARPSRRRRRADAARSVLATSRRWRRLAAARVDLARRRAPRRRRDRHELRRGRTRTRPARHAGASRCADRLRDRQSPARSAAQRRVADRPRRQEQGRPAPTVLQLDRRPGSDLAAGAGHAASRPKVAKHRRPDAARRALSARRGLRHRTTRADRPPERARSACLRRAPAARPHRR